MRWPASLLPLSFLCASVFSRLRLGGSSTAHQVAPWIPTDCSGQVAPVHQPKALTEAKDRGGLTGLGWVYAHLAQGMGTARRWPAAMCTDPSLEPHAEEGLGCFGELWGMHKSAKNE